MESVPVVWLVDVQCESAHSLRLQVQGQTQSVTLCPSVIGIHTEGVTSGRTEIEMCLN